MNDIDDVPGVQRFPPKSVEYLSNDWLFKCTRSHILSSKCNSGSGDGCCADEDEKKCQFCLYTQKINLPHLPDMVFADNVLSITNSKAGLGISFNALDSLSMVCDKIKPIEVACSEEWKEGRSETGHTEKTPKPYDWTYSTEYKGTLLGKWKIEPADQGINWDKLRRKDAILFFHELTLYEDELHDHGISQLSVKIRVMPEVFFILLRYFLRVDDVMVRISDTRFYHEFNSNCVIREYTCREAKIPELSVPTSLLRDPNEIAPKLPIIKEVNEKLMLSDM